MFSLSLMWNGLAVCDSVRDWYCTAVALGEGAAAGLNSREGLKRNMTPEHASENSVDNLKLDGAQIQESEFTFIDRQLRAKKLGEGERGRKPC